MAPKRCRSAYTEAGMTNAVLDITDNGYSQNTASQKWGIPQQSISNRLGGQTPLEDQV